MNYKLIAIDIDGTLITEDKVIRDKDKEAIKYALDKGVNVVIASGRISASASIFATELGLDSYIISSNGAMVKDIRNDEIIYKDILPLEEALWAVKLYENEKVYYHAYVEDSMYVKSLEGPAEFYLSQNRILPEHMRIDVLLCEDFPGIFNTKKDNILKVMAIDDDTAKINKIKEKIKQNRNVMMMSSWDNNVEVMNKSVSKGRALKFLSDKLDISKDEIIAIGDNHNDIAMIEYAKIGVAMGNAVKELKEKASYVTANVENNGVAEAIYKFIK